MTLAFSAGAITHTQRVAARTAGYALLFMAVAAVFAFFIAIEGLAIASITFVGELLLMVWLLFGFRRARQALAPA